MKHRWSISLGALLAAMLLALSVYGCAARPAPRPEADPIDADTNAAVARTASEVPGTGQVAAVVVGHTAIVALDVGGTNPGGTEGTPLTGPTDSGGGTQLRGPSSGPVTVHGPGGSPGTTPALPGGGLSPGGATPGGTPHFEQAAPGQNGYRATRDMGDGSIAAVPGAVGASPMDVMHRVADQIKSKHRFIQEVRFLTNPDQARRLQAIFLDIDAGGQGEPHRAELSRLAATGMPAGTYQIPQHVSPDGKMPPTE